MGSGPGIRLRLVASFVAVSLLPIAILAVLSSREGGGELMRVAEGFNRMAEGLEREALVRELFGQYVTPELAEKAIEERGRLDGQLVTCTALFADIRDFTGLTESLPPSVLIGILNRYFERMSAVVVDEGR